MSVCVRDFSICNINFIIFMIIVVLGIMGLAIIP